MRYEEVKRGIFQSRPNRFIAQVELEGRIETAHVKNTGRCRELLLPNASVYLARGTNPNRRTAWDLIAVEKGTRLVNMDSQAPNTVAAEAMDRLFPQATLVRREHFFGRSRFDFYVETAEKRHFIEVKGVTLERNGAVFFPDAPTERGVKHLRELIQCREAGYEACLLFVIQMRGVSFCSPNDDTDPAFGEALREAAAKGVRILAYDCFVTPEELRLGDPVEVRL